MAGNQKTPLQEGAGLIAGPTRLELATSGVTGRHSNQIELRSLVKMVYKYNSSDCKSQIFFYAKKGHALEKCKSFNYMI